MRIDNREGNVMNVTLTKEEIEEAVTLWLHQKHGLDVTAADKNDEKKKYSSALWHSHGQYATNVEVTVTLVKGVVPPTEQPYR